MRKLLAVAALAASAALGLGACSVGTSNTAVFCTAFSGALGAAANNDKQAFASFETTMDQAAMGAGGELLDDYTSFETDAKAYNVSALQVDKELINGLCQDAGQ